MTPAIAAVESANECLLADCGLHAPLCSGQGQWHSPNNARDPRPYIRVSLADIQGIIADPLNVTKEEAQWAIFSTLPSRVHSEQKEKGQFYALWADVDETGGRTFNELIDLVKGFLPDFLGYTSSSATVEKQKARVIVPLAERVDGWRFIMLQKILNDKLDAAGIIPDRATERAGQICYLPNRGEYYRYHIENSTGPMAVDAWADDIQRENERREAAEVATRERREQARMKATRCANCGCKSPIDAYNTEYDLPAVLDWHGYTRKGNRWLSPNSQSGTPGVSLTTDGKKWLSTHGSDSGIGTSTSNGTMGDAFDLFTHYEHGGNRDRATAAAAVMFGLHRQQKQQRNEPKNESSDTGHGPKTASKDDWPEPVNLFNELSLGDAVWCADYCPNAISDFAFDDAERMGVRPEQVAGPAIIAASGCIDDRIQVQPKREDFTWRESARIWGIILGDSGSMKSPAKQRVDRMIQDIESGYYQEFKSRLDIYEAEVREYDNLPKRVKAEAPPPNKPVQPRLVCKQATVEAMRDILQDGGGATKLACLWDELSGWFGSFDAYRQSKAVSMDRSLILELWNGGPTTVDRAGKACTYVPNWSASISGTITPEVMAGFFGKLQSDGLLQRFLLYRSETVTAGEDRKPAPNVEYNLRRVFQALINLKPQQDIEVIRLTDGAHAIRERFTQLLSIARSLPGNSPALHFHINKYPGIFARLVLTYHLIEAVAGGQDPRAPIQPHVAKMAASALVEYHIPVARIFYGQIGFDSQKEDHGRDIAGYILSKKLIEITSRELSSNIWALRSNLNGVRGAMELLEAFGWARALKQWGKAPTRWAINPKVHMVFKEQADAERERRAKEREKIRQAVNLFSKGDC